MIASALALATHYYAVLAVVPEALWLLVVHRRAGRCRSRSPWSALCGLGLIPLAISQHGTGRGNWIANAPFWRTARPDRRRSSSSGFDGPAHGVFEPLAIAPRGLALVVCS